MGGRSQGGTIFATFYVEFKHISGMPYHLQKPLLYNPPHPIGYNPKAAQCRFGIKHGGKKLRPSANSHQQTMTRAMTSYFQDSR